MKNWPATFLLSLERCGSVDLAAQAAGVCRSTAYRRRWRKDAVGAEFAGAWDRALEKSAAATTLAARVQIAQQTQHGVAP